MFGDMNAGENMFGSFGGQEKRNKGFGGKNRDFFNGFGEDIFDDLWSHKNYGQAHNTKDHFTHQHNHGRQKMNHHGFENNMHQQFSQNRHQRCQKITRRVGNQITTFTQCS
uniref:Uncharacterized protein n=1 Tax=Arion vulgaris TaxID=1028688 RepID=A0A0B6ZII3_9EUPU